MNLFLVFWLMFAGADGGEHSDDHTKRKLKLFEYGCRDHVDELYDNVASVVIIDKKFEVTKLKLFANDKQLKTAKDRTEQIYPFMETTSGCVSMSVIVGSRSSYTSCLRRNPQISNEEMEEYMLLMERISIYEGRLGENIQPLTFTAELELRLLHKDGKAETREVNCFYQAPKGIHDSIRFRNISVDEKLP